MTTIVTRSGKGSSLSWSEVDSNFTNLNTDKAETSVVDLKAPLASPTFTGTVSGITSTMVGLGNVDNTSDATKNAATATLTNKTIAASTNTVEAMSGPNNSPLSFRNKIINGEVTRINQRGVANWAAVANGAYGYDRWKKIDASNMTQIIEAGNFHPSTVHTLSGVGVTTQQITSPASGHWTLPNIPIAATNVQLEEGLEATPFEVRHIGLELVLCQRYCQFIGSDGAASIVGTGFCNDAGTASAFIYVPLIVPMRSGLSISMVVLSALTNFGVSNFAGSTATTIHGISVINSNSVMVKVQVNWSGGAIVQKDAVELFTGPTTSGLVMTSEL